MLLEIKLYPTTILTLSNFQKEKNLKVIFALGGLAHRQILQCIGEKQSHFKFGHGKIHTINGKKWKIVNSYHPSRYNINTKRLTYNMFLDVIQKLAN